MTSSKPLPLPTFGVAPKQYDALWMSTFLSLLGRRISLLAGPNTIQQQIILQSPNGTVYQVTVSDTGTLTTSVATRGVVQPPL